MNSLTISLRRVFNKLKKIWPSNQPESTGFTQNWAIQNGLNATDFGIGSYGVPHVIGHNRGKLEIGRFCSISDGVTIVLANHDISLVTTYPFTNVDFEKEIFFASKTVDRHAKNAGDVRIGNDVWLGKNSIILGGVTVGDGAVVGAGAVVTKDVPEYSVVVGNPGVVVRKRFSDPIISKLKIISWWNWPPHIIRDRVEDFFLPIEDFVAKYS
jgi:virginiamycin A acetyltransferase